MHLTKISRTAFILCLFAILPAYMLGQASLPTSYSFWGPVPEGWTISNAGGTYQQGSDNTPACRLDATGQYVEIFFDEAPGELIYFLRGMTGGTPWSGTFSIQESVNGQTWNTKRSITSLSHQSYTEFRDTLNHNSRYARFYYTNKASGSNLALDDVTLTPRLPGENAFTYIYFDEKRIYPGSQIVTGNAETSVFVVNNLGSAQSLVIQNILLTGEHSSHFTISGIPGSIPPGGSASFELIHNQSGTGSRFVSLNVQSNAENTPQYNIHAYAIAGDFATQPTAQPGGLNFEDVKSYAYVAAFNHANPQPEKYLVLRSKGQPVIGAPADGVTYRAGDAIGNARVVYVGNQTEFTPRGVVAGTVFHHSIFSFNGPPGYENYLQNNPHSAMVQTPANMIGDYYEGINSNNEDFLESLQDRIRPHTPFAYGDYTAVMINGFESLDTTGNKQVVYCVMSGFAHIYDGPFGWDGSPIGGTLSREHTFPFSWYPHSSQSSPEYSDFFNLFPAHLQSANIPRSNHPLGVVVNVTSQFLGGKLGTDANGNTVYEPRDSHKGDAARAKFYMVTRYHNSGGYEWYLPPQQNQEILKLWHFVDPPDAWEKARNDYIYSKQGNRNPFIDSIHFVTKIDFQTMEWLSVDEIEKPGFTARVYPNPAKDFLRISLDVNRIDSCKLTLFTLAGSPVRSVVTELNPGSQHIEMDLTSLPAGVYILNLICGDNLHSIRIMKL